MPDIKITCPNCRFSREHDASAIPANVAVAVCPQCRQRFDLRAAIAAAAASEPVPPVPEPVPPELPESAMPAWGQLMPEPVTPAEPPPTAPVPPAAPRPASPRRLRFAFTGTARDYFGIWIVNTLLKIVTLGIYSAWAKVRKRRYFYGSTKLNNTDFEYLADPFALFKGWLIAAAVFILYTIGSKVSPILSGTVGLVFFLGLPWLIVRSRVFNMRNSAHRNIRFTFSPDYREAYVAFAGLPCLLPFTLGLIAPYMVYRQKKFFVENSGYGRTRCTFDATVKDFYLVFLKAAGWLILLAVGLGLSAYFISATARELSPLLLDGGAARGKIGTKGA